jgi:rhamnose utilization protein RhaD (predicted bifunctional aldolase and dehydrogenase)
MKAIIKLSRQLGQNIAYVQGRGGNASFKTGSRMYVKSSGVLMKDLTIDHFLACKYKNIAVFFDNQIDASNVDTALNAVVEDSMIKISSSVKPSLETGMHAVLPSRYVIHTHSIYANVFNCMDQPEKYLEMILHAYSFKQIPYKNPGFFLASYLADLQKSEPLPSLIFLRNHGLVLHGNTLREIVSLHKKVNELLRQFIEKRTGITFIPSNNNLKMANHLFPDSIVYSEVEENKITPKNMREFHEIVSATQYIHEVVKVLGEKIVYISDENVRYIQELEREKYRMRLISTQHD